MNQDTRPIELRPEHLGELDPRIQVPSYDRELLGSGILHIGVGGFHRSHQAEYLDDLCNGGLRDWSITGAGVLPHDAAMAAALNAQDGLFTLLTRSQHETSVRVIGTIVRYIHAFPDLAALVDRVADPSTRIVSLTITEGGYPVDNLTGESTGASSPVFEAIVSALDRRRSGGLAPPAVMSCDNILHNGRVTKTATLAAAKAQSSRLAEWIDNAVPFPSTMVDRITPATEDSDRTFLAVEYGLADQWPVVAEPFRQWVIEDTFSLGRPPWEDAGALITGDVEPYELLKLRLLNAGHSTLAYLAALAGYEFVNDVTTDHDFAGFLRLFLDREASPALPKVSGVDIEAYKLEIVERFSNPAIRDQVSRLCLDGSSKFPVFLLPTIEVQLARHGSTMLAALALAGWCQYLLGRDDSGRAIQIADDPRKDVAIRHAQASREDPGAFLEFSDVFPRDLASSETFRAIFTRALQSLRSKGAQATVADWVQAAAT
jgi:mannitol 2-dehydrogenase